MLDMQQFYLLIVITVLLISAFIGVFRFYISDVRKLAKALYLYVQHLKQIEPFSCRLRRLLDDDSACIVYDFRHGLMVCFDYGCEVNITSPDLLDLLDCTRTQALVILRARAK